MNTVQEAVSAVAPSVVGLGRGARGGSGIVIGPGRVLTLAHRLRREEVEILFADGRSDRGQLLGSDPDLNVAVLEVDTGDAPAIRWAGGDGPEIGDRVVALSDPGGRGLRATEGAISAVPTRLRGRRGRPIDGVLEHTAPMPRGSGGGPLVSDRQEVLGINALREPGGFILALPATEVRVRVEALLEGRVAEPRQLGVAIVPPRAARRMRQAVGLEPRDGLLVREVADGSPAAAAGLQRGDLLVGVDGAPLRDIDELYSALDGASPDRPMVLRVLRGSDELDVPVLFSGAAPETV